MSYGRSSLLKTGVSALVLSLCRLPAALAEIAESAAEPPRAVPDAMTIGQMMQQGGSLMWVLAVMSVLLVALIIYLAVVLRASQIVPRFLYKEVMEKIRSGAIDDARKACEYQPSPLAAVVLAAVDYVRATPDAKDQALLKDIVEGEGSRQADAIQGQTQFLLDIAVIAPMVGLLGTIFGMLQAFGAVAYDLASAKPMMLAAGVSKALLTTAFGLIVGIPAMTCYAYFRRKASRLVSLLEAASAEILTVLASKRSK